MLAPFDGLLPWQEVQLLLIIDFMVLVYVMVTGFGFGFGFGDGERSDSDPLEQLIINKVEIAKENVFVIFIL